MTEHLLRLLAVAVIAMGFAACSNDTTAPEEPISAALPETAVAAAAAASSWTARADMPSTERWGLATVTVTNAAGQSVVYAIGGATSTRASLGKVMAYNVATNSWSYKASLPIPLYWTNGAGVIGGKIYISGGLSGHKGYRDVLFMYDPARNRWTQKRAMPNTSFRGVTTVLNDKLYVVTGCDQEDCDQFEPRAFYRYDPVTDMWATLPPAPHTHNWGMGGAIGGKFYVTSFGNLDVYDPVTNLWTTKAPMPSQRWLGGGAVLGSKLYVIGGYRRNPDGSTTAGVRNVSVYDPNTDAWTTGAQLPTARASIPAVKVKLNGQARIELIGGSRPGNNLQYIP
jgi:N-acetylneuraminic acid mutarotase